MKKSPNITILGIHWRGKKIVIQVHKQESTMESHAPAEWISLEADAAEKV